jgi:hypothetical protein
MAKRLSCLALGALAGLVLALALKLLTSPDQVVTIIDPNQSTASLSVRVLGVEIHHRDGREEQAEEFRAAAQSWANGLLGGWLLLGLFLGATVAALYSARPAAARTGG